MADRHQVSLSGGLVAQVRFTDVSDGDFRVRDPEPGVEGRRAELVDLPWSWILQVHGDTVLTVAKPGQHAGETADGLVSAVPGCPIAVTTADCAPVVLIAERGVAVVHAGWRGLVAGIIGTAAKQLAEIGGAPVTALLGPCIGPGAYEFGRSELDKVVERLGPGIESVTDDGRTALDVPAAVGLACEQAGWPVPERPSCTSDQRWFSHRTRQDLGRQTAIAWLELQNS